MSYDAYYTHLFTRDPDWSTRYPNPDEAARWGVLLVWLSRIAQAAAGAGQPPRALDVGCGRGWLTSLASVFTTCEGLEPVAAVVEHARQLFPEQQFHARSLASLLEAPGFVPYDVVIASEVIEHVDAKEAFIAELRRVVRPGGDLLLTTPRGEFYSRWKACGFAHQPVEQWLAENRLADLFGRFGWRVMAHERVYLDLPQLSWLHRICISQKLARLLRAWHLEPLLKGLQFHTAFYQAWWLRLAP